MKISFFWLTCSLFIAIPAYSAEFAQIERLKQESEAKKIKLSHNLSENQKKENVLKDAPLTLEEVSEEDQIFDSLLTLSKIPAFDRSQFQLKVSGLDNRGDFKNLVREILYFNGQIPQTKNPPTGFSGQIGKILNEPIFNNPDYFRALRNDIVLWITRDLLDTNRVLIFNRETSEILVIMKTIPAKNDHELELRQNFYQKFCQNSGLKWKGRDRNCGAIKGTFPETLKKIERASSYLPHITEVCKKHNKLHLALLPYFESGYDFQAISRAKAKGMWQFIAPTARIFGLKVNRIMDERESPFLATEAAMQYFAKAEELFPNQELVQILSYNVGFRSKYFRLLDHHPELDMLEKIGYAPRHYIPSLLAASVMFDNLEKFVRDVEFQQPEQMVEVKLPKPMIPQELEKGLIFDKKTLIQYNPQLRESFWNSMDPLPEGYRLYVPAKTLEETRSWLMTRLPDNDGIDTLPDNKLILKESLLGQAFDF